MQALLKSKIISGTAWTTIGKISYMLIAFCANIVLARLLGPSAFGELSILMFFVISSKILTESGLVGAIIRIKDPKESDYSTVFIFNIVISIVIYLIIFSVSPYIQSYYGIGNLDLYLKLISVVVIIDGFKIIQDARLQKEMNFKNKYKYEVISISIASFVSIVMAYNDYGVYSLILLQVLNSFLITLFFWSFEGGLKQYSFDKDAFKRMFKFGRNTTLASLINSSFDNLYQLLFAKYFSILTTGFYYQAKKIQELPTNFVQSIALGVGYSSLVRIQDENIQFNRLFKSFIDILTSIMGYILLISTLFADLIIEIIYGADWLESVPFLRILMLSAFFSVQEIFNRIVFKVFDKTQMILKLEILKKIVLSLTIFIGVYYHDVFIILWGLVLTNILSFILNYYYSSNLYNKFELMFFKNPIITIIIVGVIYLINDSISVYITRFYHEFIAFLVYTLVYFIILNQFSILNLKTLFNVFKKNK